MRERFGQGRGLCSLLTVATRSLRYWERLLICPISSHPPGPPVEVCGRVLVSECKLPGTSRGFILSSYPVVSLKLLLIIWLSSFLLVWQQNLPLGSATGEPFSDMLFLFDSICPSLEFTLLWLSFDISSLMNSRKILGILDVFCLIVSVLGFFQIACCYWLLV